MAMYPTFITFLTQTYNILQHSKAKKPTSSTMAVTQPIGSNDLCLHVVEPSGVKRRLQIEITLCCCLSQRVVCLWSVRTDPHFDHRAATMTTGPYTTPAPSEGDDIHANPGSATKYHCPVCL